MKKKMKNNVPNGWQEKKMDEICVFRQGIQVDLDLQLKEKKDGYVKFLRIENYTQHSSDFRYITKEKVKKNSVISKQDIVVVRYGATAGYISRGLEGVLANNLFTIKPISKIEVSNNYLFRLLKQERIFFYLQMIMAGGAMPALSFSMLKPIKFLIPPLPEQKRIVRVLETWDEVIEKLNKKIEIKKKIKRGLMQKLLTGAVRLPGFTERWRKVKLGEVSSVKRGDMITKNNIKNGSVPVIAGGRLPAYYHNSCNYSGKTITVSGSGASAGYINYFKIPIFASDCSVIKTSYKKINLDFIYYFLLNKQGYIYSLQSGGAQPHVYPKDLQKIKILLPNLKEQNAIVGVLIAADNEIEVLEKQLSLLKDQKKYLLNNLVAGKIRTPENLSIVNK